ncbi:MAG: metallophosphoesterase [Coriobacteriia bacterium]|nr:metallophosphoesterase [Coriobacteriia bacterium]
MTTDGVCTIGQFSDIHCGDGRFDAGLMERLIHDLNRDCPDLVACPGDLTEKGYPDQFELAKSYIDRVECTEKVVIPGNHDSRNVGYVFFDRIFGQKFYSRDFPFPAGGDPGPTRMRVVCADSSKPDLNEGEIGRDRYGWLREQFAGDDAYKVFVVHHHLVPVPGTGRERNIAWDAGDILEILMEAGVDLVLAGHKHVPHVWPIAGMLAVTSGTATSWRTRGVTQPSYNLIRIREDSVEVEVRHTADERRVRQVFARTPEQRIGHVLTQSEKPDPGYIGALR